VAGHAGKTGLEALCRGPERAAPDVGARGGAQFGQNDFQFDVFGGLSCCRIYGEEAGAARHSRQLPCAAKALEEYQWNRLQPVMFFPGAVTNTHRLKPVPLKILRADLCLPEGNGLANPARDSQFIYPHSRRQVPACDPIRFEQSDLIGRGSAGSFAGDDLR